MEISGLQIQMNGNFRGHEWKFTTSTLQMNGNFRKNKWKFPSPTLPPTLN